MSQIPANPISYHYINTPSELKRLTKTLHKAQRIAIDIEANSLYRYYEKVCLIQLTTHGHNYIVDPLVDLDLTELLEIISQKDLIFHCGDYDLRMLKQSYGFRAKGRIFDTMIAAKLLGYKQYSLMGLIDNFTGIRVSKSSQKSNWTRRPLTEKQLLYASTDTHHLELIAIQLEQELREKDRLHWHDQAVEKLLDVIDNLIPPINCCRTWRIKGSRDLSPRQLTILRELWWWRESEAALADLPPFKIIINDRLIGLTRAASHHHKVDNITSRLKLPCNFKPDRIQRMHAALQRAMALPPEQWPSHIQGDYRPDYPSELFEQLRRVTAQLARPLNIEPSIIAPRAVLGRIAGACPDSIETMFLCAPSLLPWQARLIFKPFMKVIDNYQANSRQ